MSNYDAALMTRRANYYLSLGFALTPVKYGDKIPAFGKGWNKEENLILDAEKAAKWYSRPYNIGVQLGASGLNSLDIDDLELSRVAFAKHGLNIDDILNEHPHVIQGAGFRLWFRASENDPIESRRYLEVGGDTAYEIRGGNGFQDVAPGSLHPNGYEYRWAKTPPRTRADLPASPEWLYHLYESLAERPEKASKPTPSRPVREYTGPSVIEAYNSRYDVREVLERNGYKRRGNRYLSPNSKTKMAGVEVYVDGDKCRAVSYHTSDGWADKRGHDAFDLFTLLEHDGNATTALEAARQELGMERPSFTPPASSAQPGYTQSEAVALWNEHMSNVLELVGENITARPVHHNAREALISLMAYIFQAASEGQLSGEGRTFALMLGGIRSLAALVGGRPADCKARLEWLADNGMVAGLRRVDPSNPASGLVIDLPGDPRDLPFLKLSAPPPTPGRPQTKAVRDVKKQQGILYPPPGKPSMANAVGRVKSENAKNPLRALLSLVLCLRRNKNIGLKSISQKLGMRLNTTRKKFAELQELGYLDVSGNLTCTVDQFLADLRACGAEGARKRLINTLERQREYAVNQLARIVFDQAVRKDRRRYEKMLSRCDNQLERLYDGEAPHAVIGRAA